MKKHSLIIVVSIIGGILLLSMIVKNSLTSPYKVSVKDQAQILASSQSSFSLLDLAMAIKDYDPNILFIDLRPEVDYANGHLPNAINVPLPKLFDVVYSEYIDGREDIVKVIYANGEVDASRALSLLAMRGFKNFKVLSGGYAIASDFIISEPTPSYFHYSEEQKKLNYNRLMPAGGSSAQAPKQQQTIELGVPRGGC
jgi:rhodanese-related sulfurtransferase